MDVTRWRDTWSTSSSRARGMRRLATALATAITFAATVVASPALSQPAQRTIIKPGWAYPSLGSAPPAPSADGVRHRLAGSALALTEVEIFDTFTAHDWFPELHPPMPEVVAIGRRPEVRACGMCHYPNGQGRPENAALAGLPEAYIRQQMADYKSGKRRSSEPNAGPQVRMLSTALHADDADVAAAARYFSGLKYQPWVKVVETATVPKTRVVIGNMWAAVEGGGTEPIGRRIVEIPKDYPRAHLRDPRAGFVAYVPSGSIARGEAIARTGAGKTLACVTCHGAELRGVGDIPPLAGRSPQYLARQLFDMINGTRAGSASAPMMAVVAGLGEDEVIDVLAYAASLKP